VLNGQTIKLQFLLLLVENNENFIASDTHTFHNKLNIPEADIAIFAGDESNNSNPYLNEVEARNFLEWYSVLPIKHKVFVAEITVWPSLISLFVKKNILN
jgi:hypothetical protein